MNMRRSALVGGTGLFLALTAMALPAWSQRAAAPPDVTALKAKLASETEGPAEVDRLSRLPAEAAVPPLTEALAKEYPAEVRWRAARALGIIGPRAAGAAGTLIAQLNDPNERIRAYSCYALGRLGGEAAQTAAPGLVERVTDENGIVRRAAIDALLALRPDRKILVPLMAKALEDAEPHIVMAAIRTLTSEGAAVMPLLTQALENEKTAYWAAVALESLGPEAAPAVTPLIKLTAHAEPEVRMEALMALAAIGEAARSAAPQIVDRLENDDFAGVRYAAAFALMKVAGGAAGDEALRSAMESDDPMLAMLASWALANVHPKDQQIAQRATELVVAGLQSEDPKLQAAAARVLGESSLSSELTQPALEKALETASPQVVSQAVHALAAQGARAVPRVVKGLQNEKLRKHAIKILGMIGPEASEAVPALVETMQDADEETRREAQFALAAIGPAAAPAVPELTRALDSENEEVQYSAVYALGRIGEQAKDSCPELLKLLGREEEFPRIAAIWALTRIDPGRPEIVETGLPILTAALQSDRDLLRAEAASTLAEIGEAARPALPALRTALNDPSPSVRQAAENAIQRIETGRENARQPVQKQR
jgi:HEAT repeat protein